MTIAVGATVMGPDEQKPTEAVEIIASRHPSPEEMDAYERVLGDAMAGDATLFAREDYVEEAWRIVDPGAESRELRSMNIRQGDLGSRQVEQRFRLREAGTTRPRARTRKISASPAKPESHAERAQ